jgi:hypothetical protein
MPHWDSAAPDAIRQTVSARTTALLGLPRLGGPATVFLPAFLLDINASGFFGEEPGAKVEMRGPLRGFGKASPGADGRAAACVGRAA